MKNWSLNAKVSAIVGVFFVACVTISVLGVTRLADLNASLDFIVTTLNKRAGYAQDMRGYVQRIVINEKNLILEDSKEGMENIQRHIDNIRKEFDTSMSEAVAIGSEEGKTMLGRVNTSFTDFMAVSADTAKLAMAGRNDEATTLNRSRGRDARLALDKMLEELVELNERRMAEENKRTEELYHSSRLTMITASVSAVLLGCILAFLVLRAVSRSIDRVITSLEDGAAQVTSAAQQISSSSEELSQAATEQASSLEETASSVEEMSSMIQKNSENAKKTSSVANSSQDSATRGKDVVQSMIQAIQDINASNDEISDIVKVIAEIGNKTKVINDIVFQTKLLSFNASVEAARAGEHGKGFAVVAEEVGNLAQMSGNAAKEISALLEGSIQKVERLVATSKEKVGVGTRVAGECGEVLDEIVSNVANVTAMADEIARASDEQARGIQEITRAMSQLDQVTQQNASSSEEAASAAEELSAQAESLRNVVRELVHAIKGGEQSVAATYVAAQMLTAATAGVRTNAAPAKVLTLAKRTQRRGPKVHTSAPQAGEPAVTNPPSVAFKRAAGSDVTPAGDDGRFEEV